MSTLEALKIVCGEGCRDFTHLNLTVLMWEANTIDGREHSPALHRGSAEGHPLGQREVRKENARP